MKKGKHIFMRVPVKYYRLNLNLKDYENCVFKLSSKDISKEDDIRNRYKGIGEGSGGNRELYIINNNDQG